MSGEKLTEFQRTIIRCAGDALEREREAQQELSGLVKEARANGLPILYLADALGVSRSRIRVLARERS